MNNLLKRPGASLAADLVKALAVAARAFPLSKDHAAELPYAVRDLSRLLTEERGDLAQSYWSSPRFLAAYVRFFLPWNLYRLSWLLPGLSLGLEHAAKRPARILDLGSGPLTFPLALWCARPDLRETPLHFICADTASKPMKSGRDIFAALAGEKSPWRITLVRSPLEAALQEEAPGLALITACNVLNELPPSRRETMEERLARLMGRAYGKLAPQGRLLLVEPGTRLGGKVIAVSRKGALEAGFTPLAPCTHSGPCPMTDQPLYNPASPPFTGWCHFIHPAAGAPPALVALGKRAHMEKEGLALSCLLLEKPEQAAVPADDDGPELFGEMAELEALYKEMQAEDAGLHPAAPRRASGPPKIQSLDKAFVRIISDRIRLPDQEEPARYVCSPKGLGLLLNAPLLPSGGAVPVDLSRDSGRDRKTGALILHREGGDASPPTKKPETAKAADRPKAPHGVNRNGTGAEKGAREKASAPKYRPKGTRGTR